MKDAYEVAKLAFETLKTKNLTNEEFVHAIGYSILQAQREAAEEMRERCAVAVDDAAGEIVRAQSLPGEKKV